MKSIDLNLRIGINEKNVKSSNEVLHLLTDIEAFVAIKYKGKFRITFTENFIGTRMQVNKLLKL